MSAGSLVVTIHIRDAHHHKVSAVGWHVSFSHHDASVPCFRLDAVVCDSEPDCQAKRFSEPVGRGADIGIRKHGHGGAGWH
jgi:hypothetical protein